MKKALLLTSLLLMTSTSFALDINTGLWEVKSDISVNGKKLEVSKEIQTMMSKLPPEQKKMYEKEMAKLGYKNNVIQICHTESTLNNPKALTEKSNCTMTLKTNTAKKFSGVYNCPEDKNSGDFTVTATSKTAYNTVFNGSGPDGQKFSAVQSGKFISKNCGNVKPWIP